ncbi:hypothetical protein EWB00_007022 [Schistosoma japonicum]|uniref:Uncharacterized protein n=1 Tax=Schistosoma japonicum TaxID=6182 RepID=A0A4Z2CVW3_SCHJA|nr:hypothetical protein EWB00_007022 [Schistosoma japonicum]
MIFRTLFRSSCYCTVCRAKTRVEWVYPHFPYFYGHTAQLKNSGKTDIMSMNQETQLSKHVVSEL